MLGLASIILAEVKGTPREIRFRNVLDQTGNSSRVTSAVEALLKSRVIGGALLFSITKIRPGRGRTWGVP